MRRAAACSLLLLAACGEGQLVAADAWIREAPPGATALAGYVTLRNGTREPVRCDGAAGPDFGAIEMHRTVVESGMSSMLRGQAIEVPPGAEARLEPGGLHLMLFRPQRDLRAGARSRLTLQCGSRSVTADFEVRP